MVQHEECYDRVRFDPPIRKGLDRAVPYSKSVGPVELDNRIGDVEADRCEPSVS
jgi:hypothetical protein